MDTLNLQKSDNLCGIRSYFQNPKLQLRLNAFIWYKFVSLVMWEYAQVSQIEIISYRISDDCSRMNFLLETDKLF